MPLLLLLLPTVDALLSGVVTEYLRFGQAEGGVGDLAQLDRLMRALQVQSPEVSEGFRKGVFWPSGFGSTRRPVSPPLPTVCKVTHCLENHGVEHLLLPRPQGLGTGECSTPRI